MKSLKQIGILSFLLILAVACKKDNKSAVTGEAQKAATTTMKGKAFKVVPERSIITWEGSKLAGKHSGTLQVSDGTVKVENGKLVGGNFTIDMASLINTDLKAGEGKEDLEGHLKSADFFDVAIHPKASFEITKVTGLEGSTDANSLVYGNLTLKGVSKQVGFKANVSTTDGGVSVTTPNFTINRTDFGMKYGSASFFDNLKDKAIKDEVNLSISLGAM